MGDLAADLILFNANIITLNPKNPGAQLVAIKNSKVLKVSSNEAIKELKGARTKVIDCNSKTILPGFNDAHCHLVAFAESLITLDLSPPTVHSITEIQDRIRKLSENLPSGSWIRAKGYNEFYLAEKRHPTSWDLDKATKKHPVKLTHRSGHAHVLNSSALMLAGISKETPEPLGGMIERDLETGEPNGVLYGMSAYLANVVPSLTDDELDKGIKLANEKILTLGITSVQDASPNNNTQRWHMLQRWKSQAYLKPRVSMMLGIEAFRQFQEQGFSPKVGDSQLRLGGVKILLDETRGYLNPTQPDLNQKVFEIHCAGFQVAMHAVEETTIEAACTALEFVLNKLPQVDHRHRIEHCSVCTPTMARRLAPLKAVVVTQPAFIYYNGERYLETVPKEQLKYMYPIATQIKAGVKVAASSDCPVVPPNPMNGIYAAISRKAETGQDILPEERISPLEALRMYTDNAAYVNFEEVIKGTIAPGKLADLVILSGDPTKVPVEEIKDLEVEMTIVGGKIVWGKKTTQ